ncbi:MAG: GAF domain-containing protein [Coriobacteriia bacterium]|nr:GAF domain-containing protein [Coriobacteriia bacterium]
MRGAQEWQTSVRELDRPRLLVIGMLLLVCVWLEYLFHFALDIHEFYIDLFYIPIVLSAFWWGLKGELLVSSFLILLFVVPHLLMNDLTSVLLRGSMFVVLGFVVATVSDQLRRAEGAYQLANKELVQVFQTAADGMRLIDKDHNVFRVNKTFLDLAQVSQDQAVGMKCYEVFRGPMCHTPDCPMDKIFGGEERVECDVEKERMDGTKVSCILVATPFRGAGGSLVGIVEDFKDVTERNKAKEDLGKKCVQCASLRRTCADVSATLDPDSVLQSALDGALELLGAKAGSIMLLDEKKEFLSVAVASGLSEEFTEARERVGEGIAGHVAKTAQPLLLREGMEDARFEKHERVRGITDAISVPIKTVGEVIGVFNVDSKREGIFSTGDVEMFSVLASQVGVAIENARLYQNAREGLLNTVEALAVAVDAKDPYTRGHSDRVAEYSLTIARELSLSETQIAEIDIAARLHDVGKIGVSERILGKSGPLTDEEWKVVKEHPTISAKILEPVGFASDVVVCVLAHHERPDGEGYPNGMSEGEIPLGASIIKVADAFDAMTSDRPYRGAMSTEQALDELRRCKGTQFDPTVVEALLRA